MTLYSQRMSLCDSLWSWREVCLRSLRSTICSRCRAVTSVNDFTFSFCWQLSAYAT